MCGIAGELRYTDQKTLADWAKISALMARRGPDDSGEWSDSYCTLVFRRLAILDLSPAGHQPMLSQDGRYALVFNGEVYNFAEIRQQLEARGVRFRSRSDSEVVLYALIEWGVNALKKFNGMFALGFYDSQEHRLLLARDHAGIKPLYYLQSSNGIVFASQYNQLLTHPWSKSLGISQEALALYLRLAYIPAPYGILNSTHMLEPGAWLEVTGEGRVQQGQYYRFPLYEESTLTGEQAYEAVNSAVTAAVKRQMVSDVPLGAFLSGGIDSPLVVAKMLEASPGNVHAYTIGTSGDVTDESEDAITYARELDVEHTVEHVTSDQALEMLNNVIEACGEPFGDYSIFPTMLVSRLASRDYKVMLSGDGGDELFWGYAKRSGSLIQSSQGFRHPQWRRSLQWGIKKTFNIGSGSYNLHHYPSLGDWQRAKHTHLNETSLDRVFPGLPVWPKSFKTFDFNSWQKVRVAQWLRHNEFTCHLPMVLQKVDRASMYHSLEVRVPLLDREVIATAMQVDWSTCLDLAGMRGKLPLRHSLARHVRHQTQAKRGFEVPMGHWLRTTLKPIFEDVVLKHENLMGLELDRNALRALFDQHINGKYDLAWGLWPILSLALWADRYHL